jgi:hypothetical protein
LILITVPLFRPYASLLYFLMGAAVSQARSSSGSGGGGGGSSGSGSGRRPGAPTGAGEDVTDSPEHLLENKDGIKESHPSSDRVLEIDGRDIVDSGSEHSRKEIASDSDQDKDHDVETPLSGSGAKQEDSRITKNDSVVIVTTGQVTEVTIRQWQSRSRKICSHKNYRRKWQMQSWQKRLPMK